MCISTQGGREMLVRTKNGLLLRIVSLVVVCLFVFSNFAIADVISSSKLRPQSKQEEPGKKEGLETDLQIEYLNNNPPQDGNLIVLKRGKGLFNFGVFPQRIAINNGTAHGNNYDKEGNLIQTKMNLVGTRAIADELERYGIKIVQHGITGTPIQNLNYLVAAGMRSGHVGTNWQNIIWEVLVEEAKTDPAIRNLVNRMIDATIATDKKGKYGVKPRTAEEAESLYVAGKDKKLDQLLGKELKNILGAFREELLNLPDDSINEKIHQATKLSAIDHMKGLGSVGTATIVNKFLDSGLAMPVKKSDSFKLGFEPEYFVQDDISSQTSVKTAAVLTIRGQRGKALGVTDKKEIADIKVMADAMAKQIYESIIAQDTILRVRVSEGFGRDEVAESFKANDVIVATNLQDEYGDIKKAIEGGATSYTSKAGKTYNIEDAIIDVIEGTNVFVTNVDNKPLAQLKDSESGATSVIVTGKGVGALGNCPDVYVDSIFTTVSKNRRIEFVENPLDPELTAQNPEKTEEVLFRIAEANDITINDLEVVLMDRPREAQRLAALKEVQKKYKGLDIVQIKDGTVAHALLATFGRRQGKHKVFMSVGGSPEGFMNLAVAGLFAQEGAVGSLRIYSSKLNKDADGKTDMKDLSRRYIFSDEEQADIRKLRPEDAEQILRGEKLFTQEDVKGEVKGSFAFITNNGVFRVEGVKANDVNDATVTSLRIGKINGKPCVWSESKFVPSVGMPETLVPKPKFVYNRGPDYSSVKGRDLFQALEGTDKAIMCANIRHFLSVKGIIEAAKQIDSFVIFQQALSELGYTFPGGFKLANATEFANRIKEICRQNGFKNFAIKGDHITVKVDEAFLKDKVAQDRVAALFEKILAEEKLEVREKIFKDEYQAISNLQNPTATDTNYRNALKSIDGAFNLVKTEVAADYTVFALDASFMPMRLNALISAFLAGYIPEDCGLEAEVGEIGGNENSTVSEALELLTGIKYREKVFVDAQGSKYSKLVKQSPVLTVVDELGLDKDKISDASKDAHKKGDKIYPFVINALELLSGSPDGLVELQNIKEQLSGQGNIKFVLHIARDGLSQAEADAIGDGVLQKINEKNGNYTAVAKDDVMIVAGKDPKTISMLVKARFGNTDIYRVIGSKEYVKSFENVKGIILNPADISKGQMTLMADALKVAVESTTGEVRQEYLEKLNAIVDKTTGDINIMPRVVSPKVVTAVDKYEKEVVAFIGV